MAAISRNQATLLIKCLCFLLFFGFFYSILHTKPTNTHKPDDSFTLPRIAKQTPLAIGDDKVFNSKFMTKCWDAICPDFYEQCEIDGVVYYHNTSSLHRDADAHAQVYYDTDIPKHTTLWKPDPNKPTVAISGESYANTFCLKYEKCVNRINWIISTAEGDDGYWPYYTQRTMREFFMNGHKLDFKQEIMKPKLEFKQQEQADFIATGENQEYQHALGSWFTSNCSPEWMHSNREHYMKELMKHIKIDSYGKCLRNKHLLNDQEKSTKLKEKIISSYKFYFAFENSLCKGYISEKPFQCLEYGTVPVLMLHPDNLKFMPRGSYIFVGDFASSKELADYLIRLDNDDEEYKKYFAWRNDPEILKEWHQNLFKYSPFKNNSPRCQIIELYLKWIKEGAWTLPMSHEHKSDCLNENYFPILSNRNENQRKKT